MSGYNSSAPFRCSGWNDQADCWTAPDGSVWGARALIDRQRRRPDETRWPKSQMWGTRLQEFSYPVRAYTVKKKPGCIRMLIIASTSRFHPHCAVWHLGDAAEINARCAEHNRARYAHHRARMKKRHKRHEKRQDGDGMWYALRLAARYLDRPKVTLQRWRKEICTLLGRTILTRKFEDWRGNLIDYFFKTDLDDIRSAENKLEAEPNEAETVGWAKAIAEIGACRKTVGKLLSPDAKDTLAGKRSDGRPCKLTRLKKQEIKAIADYRKQMTVSEAAQFLDVDRSVVDDLIERGLLRVLHDPFGYQRWKRVDRKQVEALKAARDAPDVSTDEQADWLSCGLAKKRYPNATDKILYKYANKPCPQLGGCVLHARTFRPSALLPMKGKRRRKGYLKWLESDLRDLVPGKVGMAGQMAVKEMFRENQGGFVPRAAGNGRPENIASAASTTTVGKTRDSVRSISVVDDYNANGQQMHKALTKEALREYEQQRFEESAPLSGQLSDRMAQFMRIRNSAAQSDFVNHVWGTDGATPRAVTQAIHRFNSEPDAPFLLTQEHGRIVKEKPNK